MELKQAWVAVAAGAVLVVLALLLWWLLRRRRVTGTVAVANTDLLRRLPEFRRAVVRQRVLAVGLAGLALVVGVAAVVGAARPLDRSVLARSQENRDVVLCLDVSGSMIDVDAQVISTFQRLADGFRGERISMVIFNSTAVPVFPLTDDYEFVRAQLRRAADALGTLDPTDSFFAGTLNGNGSSLIGDGLATCARSFDHPELERARSIILATDNEAAGRSLFSLPEAGQLAQRSGIQVYGLNPSDSPASSAALEMAAVVTGTGGVYYPLTDLAAVPDILRQVSSREAGRLPSTPQLVVADDPSGPIGLGALALGLLLVARRLRWRP
ncbi:MAG: VWA domain-containing protein [Actinomycetota bacterium]|nr:VWA domain-containing protein [Actinomycetota bacterium]